MSMEKADEIREVYDPATARKSGITAAVLAEEMGVTAHVIYDIARGKTWKKLRKKPSGFSTNSFTNTRKSSRRAPSDP